MAYTKRNYRYGRRKINTYRQRKKSASNLKKFAYQLGRVKSGIGSNTAVNDAYQRGLNAKNNKKEKKPLF